MTQIAVNLNEVRAQIAAAAQKSDRRPDQVQLLAVSKTWPAAAVREAAAAGQRAFGENYVQEACDKIAQLAGLDLVWHFIGPIQSNKTRQIANAFAWVHSVDRFKVAQRLSEQRDVHLPELNVCLQVNISGEASKSGVAPEALGDLARQVRALPRLRLRGLMGIPEPSTDEALLRSRFALLRQLCDELNGEGMALDTLSMGMSQDMALAIAEGATIVRVGSAIFGARPAAQRSTPQA